jgi:aspartate aminotransferase-like enzyme
MVYGSREALRAVQVEGLPERFVCHRLHGEALRAGLDALGLSLQKRPSTVCPSYPVLVPDGGRTARARAPVEDFGTRSAPPSTLQG